MVLTFLTDAIARQAKEEPETARQSVVAILGGHAEELEGKLALPVYPLGYVSDEHKIVEIYNAVDVFVLPSVEDNLPNTIMEAMACGVPCVGFKTGGIPEEIDHLKTGYVAKQCNADDLMRGIKWVLDEADPEVLRQASVRKVSTTYSQNAVSLRYIEVYNQAMAFKHYGI